MFVRKDVFFDVHLHVEEQFEEQFAYAQVFADHLRFLDGEDVLEVGLFSAAIFEEIFYLSDFVGDFHHPEVVDFLGSLDGAPLEILSEIDDDRMEGECKKHLLFELIINLLNNKAMLLRIIPYKPQPPGPKLNLPLQQPLHPPLINQLIPPNLLQTNIILLLVLNSLQYIITPSHIDVWVRIDLTPGLLGQLELDCAEGAVLLAWGNVDEDWVEGDWLLAGLLWAEVDAEGLAGH